jgi:hypothetical protein
MAVSPYAIYVRVEFPAPEGSFSARALSRAKKASFQAMGEAWVREMLPLRFQPGNTSRYTFAPRSDKYVRRKRLLARVVEDGIHVTPRRRRAVLFGGEVPLVFHGDLAKDVTTHHEIKAYPTRCTIRLGSGNLKYLTSRPRRKALVNMAKEIRQVIPDEVRELIRIQAETYFASLAGREGKYIYDTRQ